MTTVSKSKPKGSEGQWLDAAYEALTEGGVEAVKIMALAKRRGLTRTGFYWHFKNLDALLDAIVTRWENQNTGNLVAQSEAYAESITEAMLNLFDCWHDPSLFDAPLDLAIRNWARNDAGLQVRLDHADHLRLEAIIAMFRRFGYLDEQADVRSKTVLFTQIGYISMQIEDCWEQRIARVPNYVEVFTGRAPSRSEIDRFEARHHQERTRWRERCAGL